MGHRVLLTGLAVGPAVALVIAPLPSLGLPLTLALGGAGSVYALVSAFRVRAASIRSARSGEPLLRPDAFVALPPDLPATSHMRHALDRTLSNVRRTNTNGPLDADTAIARALNRILGIWDCSDADALSRDEVTELFLLEQLLRCGPDRAGALAQLFRRPDVMLEIRDEITAIRTARARYDRNLAAYEATNFLWERARENGAPNDLLGGLQALRVPDPDLWHHVVLNHDHTEPGQRAAALWCLRQPECDRATIANFMADLAAAEGLRIAARRGDTAFLQAVLQIITDWNRGVYKSNDLALSPPDAVSGAAPLFEQALESLATTLGESRWPLPVGMFTEYDGRPPRARHHWNLATGRPVMPPARRDYFRNDPPLYEASARAPQTT